MRVIPANKVLTACAGSAVILLLISATSTGAVSGWSLLAIGLCNSIMYPSIFSLSSEGLGIRAADGAGILSVAVVGGAVIPPLTGHLADQIGLHGALIIPACCYVVVATFGLISRRLRN